jgi:hypothetical protein
VTGIRSITWTFFGMAALSVIFSLHWRSISSARARLGLGAHECDDSRHAGRLPDRPRRRDALDLVQHLLDDGGSMLWPPR